MDEVDGSRSRRRQQPLQVQDVVQLASPTGRSLAPPHAQSLRRSRGRGGPLWHHLTSCTYCHPMSTAQRTLKPHDKILRTPREEPSSQSSRKKKASSATDLRPRNPTITCIYAPAEKKRQPHRCLASDVRYSGGSRSCSKEGQPYPTSAIPSLVDRALLHMSHC